MTESAFYDDLIERTRKASDSAGARADAALKEILEKFKAYISTATLPLRWEISLEDLENKIPEGWVSKVTTSLIGKISDPRLAVQILNLMNKNTLEIIVHERLSPTFEDAMCAHALRQQRLPWGY